MLVTISWVEPYWILGAFAANRRTASETSSMLKAPAHVASSPYRPAGEAPVPVGPSRTGVRRHSQKTRTRFIMRTARLRPGHGRWLARRARDRLRPAHPRRSRPEARAGPVQPV